MSLRCLVYGLGVEYNVPIAGLAGTPAPDRIDLRMHLGEMPQSLADVPQESESEFYSGHGIDEFGEPCLRASKLWDGQYFRVRYSDLTVFVIDAAGTELWATWAPEATIEDTATYLLGPILGFVLRLRGITCLHASAIAVDGCAIAVVGRSGAGKSSTAAAFACMGYPIMSDDVVAILDNGATLNVQPAYPRVRLWPQSVESMFGTPDALPRITPTWGKRFLGLGQPGFHFQSLPLPLAAVYFLGPRSDALDAPLIQEKSERESLLSLVSDTYASYMLDPPRRAAEFILLSKLVTSVPLRQATPSVDLSRISELCEAIINDFRCFSAVKRPQHVS